MRVYPLTGAIRPYAWGSHTAIAELQGRPAPTDGPEAELWLGAHPGDPSTVTGPDGPVSLATLIAGDPEGQLGDQVAAEFGNRLPFLLKVLAAQTPLSLQAHPDAAYARAAYARQEADPSAPKNYTDAYHKPEMLVALTPFEALCGFRSPAASAAAIEAFGLPSLSSIVDALRAGDLRTAVHDLLSWPQADRKPLVEAVVAAAHAALSTDTARAVVGQAASLADTAQAVVGRAVPSADVVQAVVGRAASLADTAQAVVGRAVPSADVVQAVVGQAASLADTAQAVVGRAVPSADAALAADLAASYPDDPGVLVALLLNHVRLAPGEAIWMPAGNLHAYLRGTGVELMAASDNVLRGGLTPKHVDVDELLNVLVFEVLDDPILPSTPVAPGVVTWPVPVRDFVLYGIELDGARPPIEVPAEGPRVILAVAGDIFAGESLDGTPVEVTPGAAAYAPADAGPIKLAGVGRAFVAAVPS